MYMLPFVSSYIYNNSHPLHIIFVVVRIVNNYIRLSTNNYCIISCHCRHNALNGQCIIIILLYCCPHYDLRHHVYTK